MKTKTLTIIMLCGFVCGYAQNTPHYAASTRTWTFGAQIWSDAIQMPECNKDDFDNLYATPNCRSYTEGGKTWYYYNWGYVDANKTDRLCPLPWRVPTKADMKTLLSNSNENALYDAWGNGGCASFGYIPHTRTAVYWTTTEDSVSSYEAFYLAIFRNQRFVYKVSKYAVGNQIRCVRNN
jgi:hypothetical protein